MSGSVIQTIRPDRDSHFLLRPCLCKSENVAYVQFRRGSETLWKVCCFDCGREITAPSGATSRHEIQVVWNLEYKKKVRKCDGR